MSKLLHRVARSAGHASVGFMVSAMMLVAPAGAAAAEAVDPVDRTALRVCSDPNNLPFSNREGKGFENRIAELFARELGVPLEYTWHPQRMGFVRNTLKAWIPEEQRYQCDLILEVSSDFEMGVATDPYYHSTYAMVFVKGKGLDGVKRQEDLLALPQEKKSSLRIGVFAPGPGVDWLLRHGLSDQAVYYQMQNGDPDSYPGEVIVGDLAAGELDAVIIWGPIAGYFASRDEQHRFELIPMRSERGVRFDYAIAMGLRYREPEWKATVEGLIDRHRDEIREILQSYNVPLVEPKLAYGDRR